MSDTQIDNSYPLDKLDRDILCCLQKDARTPFTSIARHLRVSSGTIHQRINKLTEARVITGSQIVIDFKRLGYDVTTFLGIHLKHANTHLKVVEELKKLKEIIEINYTTGTYALIIRTRTKTIFELHKLLVEKIQAIPEIQATESFICLDEMLSHRTMT